MPFSDIETKIWLEKLLTQEPLPKVPDNIPKEMQEYLDRLHLYLLRCWSHMTPENIYGNRKWEDF